MRTTVNDDGWVGNMGAHVDYDSETKLFYSMFRDKELASGPTEELAIARAQENYQHSRNMYDLNPRKLTDMNLRSAIESYLIKESILFRKIIEGEEGDCDSSGLGADTIIGIIEDYLAGKPIKQKKPWEHFSL